MKYFLAVSLFVLCPFLRAGAQATITSQISGVVQDATGSAIAGAHLQLTNTDTNAMRTVDSGADGTYAFTNLVVGPYKLEVSKEGFTTFVQSGIVLQVRSNPEVNVTLQVGAVTQTVEVRANAAMVETQSNGVGQVIQPEQVLDLPLNDRQATQLIALSGAAVNLGGGNGGAGSQGGVVNNLDYPNAPAYSVAGSQANATNYYLDGSVNVDYRTNVGLPLPFPDALQEFKVESSAMSADSGREPGGAVNAITKSGSNSFHGDLFEFLRNTVMDADPTTYPSASGTLPKAVPDNLKRNQFGGVVGGPIKRDKLFFFYGFQGTEERVLPAPISTIVPTALALQGNFTQMLAPPCQPKQVLLNSAFTTAPGSNIIQPALVQTPSAEIAEKMAAFLPAPRDACGDVTFQPFTSDHEWQNVGRVDWQRTPSDTIFGRYFITKYTLLPYINGNDILSATNPGLSDQFQSADIGDTRIISPRTISTLRIAFTRGATVRTAAPGIPTWSSLGSNVTTQEPSFTGQNSVTGYISNFSDPAYPGYDYENTYGITENIGWTIGSHQLNFGFSGLHVQMNDDGLFQVNPGFQFNGTITNNALADFLTGNPSKLSQGNGQLGRDGQNILSLYYEDNWKITRTFQLNYGVRWDPFIPQHNKYKQEADFSLAGYGSGTESSVYVNAPPGMTFPGDAGFNGDSPTNSRYWDFSPRVGIVWDPRGKGLETVRAGWGSFYDTSTLWNTMHIVLDPPWGETLGVVPLTVAQGGGLANPWAGQPTGNPFPTGLFPPHNFAFPTNGTFVFEQQNIKPTNVQEWNLSVQKQLSPNWLVSATYLGSKTTHQWIGANIDSSSIITPGETAPGIVTNNVSPTNLASGSCTLLYAGKPITYPVCNGLSTETVSGVANENARRALTLLNPTAGPLLAGGLVEDFSNGNASYNGLLLTAQHRLSRNFSVLGNFTWSHCEDDGEIGQDITNSYQNPNNRRADWGNCASDRQKIVNLSLVALTPKFGSRIVETIAGNWVASGIFTASSGAYLNVTNGEDESLSGVGSDRPDLVGNPFVGGTVAANPTCSAPAEVKTIAHWYNPCAFVMAPEGSFGTFGRNGLLGPGNWNFDMALVRTFPITERFKLDFRAEAFNVFNHTEIGNPGSTAVFSGALNQSNPGVASISSTGGLITSTGTGYNQRIMQLALKLNF